MKRFTLVIVLMLCASIAFACPGENRCGCERPAAEEVDLTVVTVLEKNVEAALSSAAELANALMRDQYGATQAAEYLKAQGVSDEDIQPIKDLALKIEKVLGEQEANFMAAVACYQYSKAVNDGTVVGKLRAATACAMAVEKVAPVIKVLSDLKKEADKVREYAEKLAGGDEDKSA